MTTGLAPSPGVRLRTGRVTWQKGTDMLTQQQADEILRVAARFADTAVAAHSAQVAAQTLRQYDVTGLAMGPATIVEADTLGKRIEVQTFLHDLVQSYVQK